MNEKAEYFSVVKWRQILDDLEHSCHVEKCDIEDHWHGNDYQHDTTCFVKIGEDIYLEKFVDTDYDARPATQAEFAMFKLTGKLPSE